MLKGFSTILVKELKELIRDPKILIGMIVLPLVMFPVIGLVLGYAVETAQEQAQKATILVINNDGGNWSNTFINLLNTTMNVNIVNNITPEQALAQDLPAKNNSTQFIEIPAGFSTNMTEHIEGNLNVTAAINTYSVFSGVGIFSGIGPSTITNFISEFNRYIAPNVVYTTPSTIIKGEIQTGVDPSTLSSLLLSQSIALPITIMILLTYAMQIAATSVAMEKEEKNTRNPTNITRRSLLHSHG
jgi:ABC-2 type transport system permease protein